MEITHEQRLQMLKAHNELKDILHTLFDCHDIWMSDVGKLESMYCDLHRIFKFVPKQDEDGHRMLYADWVLADETVDPDGEQPDV